MKKIIKVSLILATVMIPVGICLLVVGSILGGGNAVGVYSDGRFGFKEGHSFDYSDSLENMKSIDVDVSNSKIVVERSTDHTVQVEIHMNGIISDPVISAENDKLQIKEKDSGFLMNFNLFGFMNGQELNDTVVIRIPEEVRMEDVKLDTGNGTIELSGLHTDNLDLHTSNGRIELDQVDVDTQTSVKTSNGAIICKGVFDGTTNLKSSNGEISVEGSLTGSVTCKTSNGAINYTEQSLKRTEYYISADTSNGSIRINGTKVEDDYTENVGAPNSVDLKTSNGSISADFMN